MKTWIKLLIILVVIGGFIAYNSNSELINTNYIKSNFEGFKLSGLNSNECPERIIPLEIDLLEYESGLWGYEEWGVGQIYYYWNPSWLDGQKMTLYPPTREGGIDDYSRKYCVKGYEEGQNINYYYCKVGYSKTTTDISEGGEIGETKTISYLIDLVLEKERHIKEVKGISLDKYNILSSTCSPY